MVGGAEQLGQVVEASCHVGMLRAEAGFVDGQRTANQRFGVREPVGGLEQLGEAIATGQKPTLSRCGIGLCQRAKAFAIKLA